MTTHQERKQNYYPLLSVAEHEMEGNLLARVRSGEFEDEPIITLVSGKYYNWYQYEEDRQHWEEEGFPSSDGLLHQFPKQLQYNNSGTRPFVDIEDVEDTIYLWQVAEHRLLRSQEPLVINFLDGDSMELYDWATEPDLVQLLKNRFPEDECFQGYFRLMMEIPNKDHPDETELRDISQLNAENWYLVLEGYMPLEVTLHYLDDEETAAKTRQYERSLVPLSIGTPVEEGKYTLENWADKPFYKEEYIHLARELQKKYPELRDLNFEMRIVLPGQEEPEDISTMTQLTQQRILEADTPLEVSLVMYEQ